MSRPVSHPAPRLALAAALSLGLLACGGGGSPAAPVADVQLASELTLTAAAGSVRAGGAPLALTAGLNGAGSVGWQLAAGSPGSLSAASGATVNYLPPAGGVLEPVQVSVTASSGKLSKTIVLSLLPAAEAPGLGLIAGSIASAFSLDGTGAAARFGAIRAMLPGANGDVYLFDAAASGSLRKVSAGGLVSTLSPGAPGGSTYVQDMAPSPDGGLYLLLTGADPADPGYLRKRAADGSFTTLAQLAAGDGATRLAANAAGQLYLADRQHIRRLAADGSLTVLAGSPTQAGNVDGAGADARFLGLQQMAVGKDGALYVIDDGAGLRRVAPDGTVSTVARSSDGEHADGAAGSGNLHRPFALALDADGNPRVLDLGLDGKVSLSVVRGGVISTLFRKSYPSNCAGQDSADILLRIGADGAMLVANDTSLARLGADGTRSVIAGLDDDSFTAVDGDAGQARYCGLALLAADQDGNVYSVERGRQGGGDQLVRKTTPAGSVSTLAKVSIGSASGIAVDAGGRVLVSLGQRVDGGVKGGALYQVEAGNKLTLIAGLPNLSSTPQQPVDGTGAAARFRDPVLNGVDAAGNLYLTDRGATSGHTTTTVYRKVTPQAVVSTIAALPADLGRAPDGYFYSASAENHAVYRYTSGGANQLLVAGTPYRAGLVLGALPARLDRPAGLVPTGPHSFALISGSALLRLVLP